jgi:mannosyl-3-phosphoglycerate phosphatase
VDSIFQAPQLPLLVFTDLDGTLLDHHDYGFEPALPALARLRALGVPLIPTTSKTLAEVASLNRDQLGNPHPCIVENGSVVCLPDGYFPTPSHEEEQFGYRLLRLAPDYANVLAVLAELRDAGFRFRGFHDMSDAQVAADSGLDRVAAARARQRLCSEPLRWEDSDERLETFAQRLTEHGLQLTRGGRYWHVMGPTSKAAAMRRLGDLYRQAGFTDFTSIALGDSPNDLEMLTAADIAVIVRRPDGGVLDCQARRQTLTTEQPGPSGWNRAMLQLIDQFAGTLPPEPVVSE